jgi:small subunit ribosomal protein S17
MTEENQTDVKPTSDEAQVSEATRAGETLAHQVAPNVDSQPGNASGTEAGRARGNRAQKVGVVASDKMEKTVVVRVDRLIKHQKYRRYVRRTSKFMAHDETGATVGDKVRIVETRPLSARKRWRVVEIVQKAEK